MLFEVFLSIQYNFITSIIKKETALFKSICWIFEVSIINCKVETKALILVDYRCSVGKIWIESKLKFLYNALRKCNKKLNFFWIFFLRFARQFFFHFFSPIRVAFFFLRCIFFRRKKKATRMGEKKCSGEKKEPRPLCGAERFFFSSNAFTSFAHSKKKGSA